MDNTVLRILKINYKNYIHNICNTLRLKKKQNTQTMISPKEIHNYLWSSFDKSECFRFSSVFATFSIILSSC